MRKSLVYTVLLFAFSLTVAAQPSSNPPVALSFPDSVRIALENTKNLDASVIGSGIAALWSNLSSDQQLEVRSQIRNMKKKRYPIKPHIINYLGAVVNAVNIEKMPGGTFSSLLAVSRKVIEDLPAAKANNFFANTRGFLEDHKLHTENAFRLYAVEAEYKFDYLESIPIAIEEAPLEEEDPYDDPYEEEEEQDGYDEEYPEQEVLPMWMTPPPPPEVFGPVISFSKVSLNFATRYDSVFLRDTKGTVSLADNVFVGNGGSFDWSAAGLAADSAYCTFGDYFFDITKPILSADLVKLTYVGKTPGFIPGNFEFKSLPRREGEPSTYPRFKSYQSDLDITIAGDKNVEYRGGFSLTGDKISSESVSGEAAMIEVSRDGLPKFKAISNGFKFGENEINSDRASVKIFQGNDSLQHPAIRMRYSFDGDSVQQLVLRKEKGEMKNTPYASSFFNVDFSADIIRWNLGIDSLDILTDGGRATVPMIIESVDYYDAEDYRLLGGQGLNFHALALVASYAIRNGVTEFYSNDLSPTGNDLPQIKAAIQFLHQKGMIDYDRRDDRIKVKPKAITAYNAFKGLVDYDNLKIHSVIDTLPNATLNFAARHMTIRGVEEFQLSDSLNVRIKPDSSIITLLQNRDMKFNGVVDAGNFKISGKGFTLRYDSFLIDLAHIDSVNFYITEENTKGQSIRKKINNSMVGTDSTAAAIGGIPGYNQKSGTLYISKANNKSGKEKSPNFPRLDASAGGVIYFDRREVLNGVYDRSMFFVVPPFKLDSLNDADPASINFDGTFVSSGMFPSFKDKLHTQPDKSLGFTHEIPSAGYQLYKGEGKMSGELNLDTRGLRGAGQIEYLAAKIHSEDFIYYPDSVVARGVRSTIDEKQFGSVLFPQASLTDFEMKWLPKSDKMVLKNKKAPFSFYDSTAMLQGSVTISKNGVAGYGRFETRGTELVSRDMKFTGNDFSARHGRFKVKTSDPDKPLLSGNDVRVRFNLKENYADISPEVAGVAAIDFPYAQVRTSIQKARWDLNSQKILMSKDPSTPIENSYFYTTRKELDSLSFNADRAEYNLQTQELKVSGIPHIVVADAKITPENNTVLILENARIGTLKNTTIVLDTLNGYHLLTDGVVDIVSRKEFSGYATYQYVNLLNDTFAIKMTDFHLEPITETEHSRRAQRRETLASLQTVATGSVSENDHLVLGAGLFYKGNMIMYATRPALQLDGYVKLDIKNIPGYNAWIKYDQSGEETEVLIDFKNAVTEEGKRATAGLHFSSDDHQPYITFINDKKSDDDEDFFTPDGYLLYDNETKEYKIEDREKAAGHKLSGKVFTYNDDTKSVRFEGPVNIFQGSKDFNVAASVIGSGNFETNEYRMNSMVMVESNVPATAFDIMARDLQEVIKNEGSHEGLGDHTELLYKIADVVGEEFAKDYEQKSLQGYVPLTTLAPLVKSLVFADVNLKWHAKEKGFYSEGLLGVSHSNRNDINGGFEGFMEIRKTTDGAQIFNVFFKASPESWYYIGFEDNRLMLHSSNEAFNDVISKKTNAGKVKFGEVAFIPGSDDETLAFINRFRKAYYGIEVPYSLSDGSDAVKKEKDEPKEKKEEEDDGF
ncbi:MAG TPA: hypothetical protein VD927_18455 [Chryseosolibacter sp.]|nr:hypothetical protein [Chryseosolibacter sp.]